MAYVKLPMCNEDYAIGYQTINQARDNQDAVFGALDAEHVGSTGVLAIGSHRAEKIPKAIAQIFGTAANVTSFGGVPSVAWYGSYSPCLLAPDRISTGIYVVPVRNLSTYWGEVIPQVTSQTPIPLIKCRSVFGTPSTVYGSNAGPALVITCYEMGTGALVATDFDFTLTVYGSL